MFLVLFSVWNASCGVKETESHLDAVKWIWLLALQIIVLSILKSQMKTKTIDTGIKQNKLLAFCIL